MITGRTGFNGAVRIWTIAALGALAACSAPLSASSSEGEGVDTCDRPDAGRGGLADSGQLHAAGDAAPEDASGDADSPAPDASGVSAASDASDAPMAVATWSRCAQTRGPVQRLYSPTSFWNIPVPVNAPIDPSSASIVAASVVPFGGNAAIANTPDWGIPIVFGHSTDTTYTVGCTLYGCSDTVTFPIPSGVVPNTGSDHHLTVIDLDTWKELDMWGASYSASSDTWSAESRFVTQANGWGAECPEGQHCLSAVAAGFAEAGGVMRPEEFAQGHIDHALTFMVPSPRSGDIVCPATGSDGRGTGASSMPEGARIQLDPTFNVAGQEWPTWLKIFATALQTYGAFVSDTGGSMAFYAEATLDCTGADPWIAAGVPVGSYGASLAQIPWDRVRVLTLESCN